MHHQRLSIRYAAPEDGPRIEEVTRLAQRLKLSLDDFISRAVILYYEEALGQLNDPAFLRQFDLDPDGGTTE